MALSETQRRILTAAAQHPHGLAEPPEKLPAAACAAVGKALLHSLLLRITDEGLRAIGLEPATCATNADTAPPAEAPQADSSPAAETAQTVPLAEDLALLDEALARPLPARRGHAVVEQIELPLRPVNHRGPA